MHGTLDVKSPLFVFTGRQLTERFALPYVVLQAHSTLLKLTRALPDGKTWCVQIAKDIFISRIDSGLAPACGASRSDPRVSAMQVLRFGPAIRPRSSKCTTCSTKTSYWTLASALELTIADATSVRQSNLFWKSWGVPGASGRPQQPSL